MTMNHRPEALSQARAQATLETRDFFDALYAGADIDGLDASSLALIAERARAVLSKCPAPFEMVLPEVWF